MIGSPNISRQLNLPKSTVQNMIKNDYSSVKAKWEPKHVVVGFKKRCIKRCIAKMHRQGDSLKIPEADSPQNQQKNSSSGFIKNGV